MSKQVVILAAGMGTRLARPLPKPLTELRDGRSIMKQQMDNLAIAFDDTFRVMIVVGFKLEAIIERFPEATFVYNEFYDQTNTSKSLLKALRASGDGGVLWLNGDQNSRRMRKQFRDLDFTSDDPVIVRNKVSMLWYPWFIQQIEEHRPKLVVWDSVTACMRG